MLFPVAFFAIVFIVHAVLYSFTTYYKVTKTPFILLPFDRGRLGEFLTYKNLRNLEATGARFLFNLYIPKEDHTTTEIDILMICAQGLYVFESKNYSGWIFGSEDQKNWYQTLPAGRRKSHKEAFYNPIMQNKSHIKHLLSFLGEELSCRSVIVFSDRCTLKKLSVYSHDISVINRHRVLSAVTSSFSQAETFLSEDDIDRLYNKLYPYTQASAAVKKQHIDNIHAVAHTASTITKPVTPSCPRCGAKLVLRTSTKGQHTGNQFWGCSNFPKCRYMQNYIQPQS